MDAVATSGWQFESWNGAGADSVSSINASFSLTVGPGSPAEETAVFYPGVEIYAAGPMSVSYSDGLFSGAVPAGTRTEVYVPPSSTLNLAAPNIVFLTTFKGWRGASNSSSTGTSFVVDGPALVILNSGYNYLGIGILMLSIALVAVTATLALARQRRLVGHKLRTAPSVKSGSSVEASGHVHVSQANKPRCEKNLARGCGNARTVHFTVGSNPYFCGFKVPRAVGY
jgi:hypothetical protein